MHAASDFLDRLAAHLQGITDPVEAVAEAIATALEWLPKDKHIGLLIVPGRAERAHRVGDVGRRAALRDTRCCADSTSTGPALGFTDADLDELAEHLLRIIQSFVIDPGRPPRRATNCAATCGGGSAPLYDRQRQRLPRLEHPRRAAAESWSTATSGNSFAAVSVSITCAVQSDVGTRHLDVKVRVDGCDDRLQRAHRRRARPARSRPRPRARATGARATKSGPNVGRHVGGRVEQRVQLQYPQRALDPAWTARAPDGSARRRCPRCRSAAWCGSTAQARRRPPRACRTAMHERQVQQVHLQADLVGDPDQRRVRERAEVDVGRAARPSSRPGLRRSGRSGRARMVRRGSRATMSIAGMNGTSG